MAYITKGIGGFYYVKTPDGVVECKARGIFRKRGITPVAGDNVALSDDGTMIDEILPRKNVFIRPPIANLDILFIVTSTTQPVPSTLVLDELAAAAIYKDVQPVLVVTKADLAAADMLRTAYTGSGIPLIQLNYETGEGLDEIRGYIQGHLCAFCGNSGVGKSTLLKLLVGILPMQQGTLEVAGLAMQRENLASIRRKVGYIFQDSDSQLFMPTVAADVAFAAQNYGYPTEEVAARTHRALQQVHIEDCADRPVYRLSGGQKKLASIAGILTLDPELILMDEPSAALDPKNRRNLIEILRGLPCAMLIASHDLDFIYDTCDRVVLLYKGRIAADGPAEEILHDGALLADCDLELPLRFQSI